MKRCVFGAVLLVLLGVLCLWGERAGSRGPEQVSALLVRAEQAEDGRNTAALADQAIAAWEKIRPLQLRLQHREKVQRIDLLLSRLPAARETHRLKALCRGLRVMLEDLQFPGSGR